MAKLSVPVKICGFSFVADIVDRLAESDSLPIPDYLPRDAFRESLRILASALRNLEAEFKEAYTDAGNNQP